MELGLWEEALVKEMRASGEWGLGSYRILLTSCVPWSYICLKQGKPFSLQHKGLYGPVVAPAGGQDSGGSQDPVGEGGNEVEDQGSRNWGE